MEKVTLYDTGRNPQIVDYDDPGCYEHFTVAAIKRLVKPGMVAYDVGANIGFFTFLLAQLGCEVHAFEPWPAAFEALQKAHEGMMDVRFRPMYDAVHLHNVGLAEVAGVKHVKLGNDWELHDAEASGAGVRCVELIALDTWTGRCRAMLPPLPPRVDFMKIDIDGYESRMLEGARSTLVRDRPVIVIELAEQAHEHHGQDVRDAIRVLNECGYRLYHEQTMQMFPLDPDEIVRTLCPKGGSINAVALPNK
jgi:FkbM family methyltransferase